MDWNYWFSHSTDVPGLKPFFQMMNGQLIGVSNYDPFEQPMDDALSWNWWQNPSDVPYYFVIGDNYTALWRNLTNCEYRFGIVGG